MWPIPSVTSSARAANTRTTSIANDSPSNNASGRFPGSLKRLLFRSRSYKPVSRDRKSGIPALHEMPAPTKATTLRSLPLVISSARASKDGLALPNTFGEPNTDGGAPAGPAEPSPKEPELLLAALRSPSPPEPCVESCRRIGGGNKSPMQLKLSLTRRLRRRPGLSLYVVYFEFLAGFNATAENWWCMPSYSQLSR